MKLVLKNIFLTLMIDLVIALIILVLGTLLVMLSDEYLSFVVEFTKVFGVLLIGIGNFFIYEYFRNKQ